MTKNPAKAESFEELDARVREYFEYRIQEKLYRISVLRSEITDLELEISLLQAELCE